MPAKLVGLLGGSFNPAHDGHLHISLLALKRLKLDEVWWLVSPHNPLKDASELAPLEARLRAAREIAAHRRIRVSDVERRLGTRYTVDTLRALTRRYRQKRFVWLMGADNFIQIARWKNWPQIFKTVPIAVFARAPYSLSALFASPARRFAASRVAEGQAGTLVAMRPPAWVFLHTRLHAASATRIRARHTAPASSGRRQSSGEVATNERNTGHIN